MSDGRTRPISSNAPTPFVASTTSTSRSEFSIVSSMARRYPASSSTTTTNWVPLPFSSSGGTDISCAFRKAAKSSASTRRRPVGVLRSEEHTSELQSQSNLVCRLLLEKKKKNQRTRNIYPAIGVYTHTG